MTEQGKLCGFLWLPGSDLRCTLEVGHSGMHEAKYYDPETGGEGQMWWGGEDLEVIAEK